MNKLSKRTIASRANGAKSHGPTSSAGRRRSSANSLRHGLLANIVVLENESKSVFGQFFDEHLNKLNPADGVEYTVVEEVAASAWRLRRLWDIEVTLFNNAMNRSTADTEAGRAADAFVALGASNQLQLLDRYETRLHRMYQRSLNTLQQLREFPETTPSPEPEEPVLNPEEFPEIPNETLMSGRSSPEMKTAGSSDEFSESDRVLELVENKGSRKVFSEEPNSDLTTNPDNDLPANIQPITTQSQPAASQLYQPAEPNQREPVIPDDFEPFQ